MTLPVNTIICGDSLDVLAGFPAGSVDCIVTDPPYGLSFMGKRWDYDVPSIELWAELLRVLKDGGRLFSFAGSRTQHRMAVNIEDAGFCIEDCMMWLYGSGFPKHKSKLKPAYEPIIIARKGKVTELQIDAARIGTDIVGARSMNQSGEASRNLAFGMKELAGGNPTAGRWPANVILSPESAAQLDQQSGTLTSGTGSIRNATGKGHQGNAYGVESRPAGTACVEYGDSGGASRFFYCAKTSPAERQAGCENLPQHPGGQRSNTSGQHVSRRDGHDPGPVGNHHPTVKPLSLMRYLCKLAVPPGSIILDPFAGSGTTLIAAALEGMQYIGIEREAEYVDIARARLKHWTAQAGLPLEVAA